MDIECRQTLEVFIETDHEELKRLDTEINEIFTIFTKMKIDANKSIPTLLELKNKLAREAL